MAPLVQGIGSKFPDRYSTTIQHFSYAEKFDTWLNLGSWAVVMDRMESYTTWDQVPLHLLSPLISATDVALMKALLISPSTVTNLRLSPILPALMLSNCFKNPPMSCHVKSTIMRNMMRHSESAMKQSFALQYHHILSSFGPDALSVITSHCPDWEEIITCNSKELLGLINICEDLLLVINLHKAIVNVPRQKDKEIQADIMRKTCLLEVFLPSLNATTQVFPSFVILDYYQDSWICPIPYFLEIYNKISESISVLKFSLLQSRSVYSPEYYHTTVEFIRHLANKVVRLARGIGRGSGSQSDRHCMLERDNRGFVYLKSIEGLGVAELIHRSDRIKGWENRGLLEVLWRTILDEKLDNQPIWEDSELFSIWSKFNSAELAGIMGIVKLVGHPSIEVERGLQKLYDRTHNNIIIDPEVCDRARAIMTRDIIKNFFRVHHRYPKLRAEGLARVPNLQTLVRENISIFETRGTSLWRAISIDEWKLVRFCKNAEFDEVDNQIMLLKDKALGLIRSKVLQKILQSNDEDPSPQPRTQRRALLAYLLDSKFDQGFRNYLHNFMDQEDWTNAVLDYLVIKLTAKELEEKAEGRFFGASPAYERNRRVVQEGNNMAFMDQYVPEQLLTPNELSIIKKMYSFRSLSHAHPDSVVLNISFDFSKWNNNMRHESVDIPAGTVLDDWFGVSLYSKTMKAFEHMLVYYDDGVQKKHWIGQKGGIEGLNQATWTFTFLGGLKDALERLGYIYHITVKGDDVRCAIVIPKTHLRSEFPDMPFKQRIESIRDNLMSELQSLCSAMGWELNPNESFVSLSLIATSKQYQINDTWLPTDVKKIMKLEALSNVAFPTVEDIVANIFSTAHSACSQSTAIFPAYWVALWTASRLLYRIYFNNRRQESQLVPDIVASLLWPQIIGGLGVLPLQTFFVRGENDMLSVSLSLLLYVRSALPAGDPICRRINFILRQSVKKKSDPIMLLTDPYSIDINCPPRPSSHIKAMLRTQLLKFCKQPAITKLLKPVGERQKKIFIDTLFSLDPYYAKIATALWECSPFYLIEEILAKFLNSSSIIGFLTQGATYSTFTSKGRSILQLLSEISQQRMEYWFNTLDGRNIKDGSMLFGLIEWEDITPGTCPTKVTKLVRNAAWRKNIKGLTYPSLVDQTKIYSTVDIFTLSSTRGWDTRDTYSQIVIKHNQAKPQIDSDSHHFCGVKGNPPWLGAQTASSVKLPFQSENIASPCIRKLRRLLTLWSSSDIFGPSFTTVVSKLIESYTDVPLSVLKVLCAEDGGGHLAHRTPINSYSLTTMPNYRPNLSQLVVINSENMTILKLDNVNRTMNFAARHFFIVPLVLLPLQGQPRLPDKYPTLLYSTFHHDPNQLQYVFCPDCNDVVDDEPVFMDIGDEFSFDHFLRFSLISCTDKENADLLSAVLKTLQKGVMDQLAKANLNPDNQLAVELAVSATYQRLISSIKTFKSHMQMEGILNVPESDLLNTLAVGVGVKPLTNESVSISVLRSCKPRFTFKTLVKEAFWHSIQVAYEHGLLFSDPPLGNLSQLYYEAFEPIFSKLAQAGLLGPLAVASNTPSSIDENDSFLCVPMIFSHGAERNGRIASEGFFRALWPRFQDWLANSRIRMEQIEPVIEAVNYEDLTQKIHRHQQRLSHLCVHILHIKMVSQFGSTKTQLSRIYARHSGTYLSDQVDLTDKIHLYLDDCFSQLYPELPARMYLIIMLSLWMIPVRPNRDEIANHIANMSSYAVMEIDWDWLESIIAGDLPFYTRIEIPSSIKGLRYFARSIAFLSSDQDCWSFWDMFQYRFRHLMGRDQFAAGVVVNEAAVASEVLNHLINIIPFISCEATDTALIKSYRKNLSDDIIREEYPNLQLASLVPTQEGRNRRIYDYRRQCRLPHRAQIANFSITDVQVTTDVHDHHNAIYFERLERLYQVNRDISSPLCITIDQNNGYKIFGGINKSAIKLWYPLDVSGLWQGFSTRTQPVCVVLGDGGGSCSRFLCTLHEGLQSIMVSLHITSTQIDQGLDQYHVEAPCELHPGVCPTDISSRIHYQGLYPGDITMPGIQNMVINMAKRLTDEVDLIVCEFDMSPDPKDVLSMMKSVMMIYDNLRGPGTLLLIRMQHTSVRFPLHLLFWLKSMFQHFHICSHYTSTLSRNEYYLILSDPTTPVLWLAISRLSTLSYPINLPIEWYNDVISQYSECTYSRIAAFTPLIRDNLPLLPPIPYAGPWDSLLIANFQSILQRTHWISVVPPACLCNFWYDFKACLEKQQAGYLRLMSSQHLRQAEARAIEAFRTNVAYRLETIVNYLHTYLLALLMRSYEIDSDLENIHLVGLKLLDNWESLNIPMRLAKMYVHHELIFLSVGIGPSSRESVNKILQTTLDVFLRLRSTILYQLLRLGRSQDQPVPMMNEKWGDNQKIKECCWRSSRRMVSEGRVSWPASDVQIAQQYIFSINNGLLSREHTPAVMACIQEILVPPNQLGQHQVDQVDD